MPLRLGGANHFDYPGAAEQYRRVVAIMPRDHVAWDRLCWSLGYAVPPRLREAEAACRHARELQHDFPGPIHHLLRVHVLQGRLAEAEADLAALRERAGDAGLLALVGAAATGSPLGEDAP